MYKRILTFLKKVILLLLSLVILLSAVACNQDTDTDDGKETYKEGLCGPDDIPKDVEMSYYGENLAELKRVYYDEYKKKCDFKCLVPNIEGSENVSEIRYDKNSKINTRPFWEGEFTVKEHYVHLSYEYIQISIHENEEAICGTLDYRSNYFNSSDIDISELEVKISEESSDSMDKAVLVSFSLLYDGYDVLKCTAWATTKLDNVYVNPDLVLECFINLTLNNLEYWE